jgi:hypothetical protein
MRIDAEEITIDRGKIRPDIKGMQISSGEMSSDNDGKTTDIFGEQSNFGGKPPDDAAEWFDNRAEYFNEGEMTGNDGAEQFDNRAEWIDGGLKPSDGRIILELRRNGEFGRGCEILVKRQPTFDTARNNKLLAQQKIAGKKSARENDSPSVEIHFLLMKRWSDIGTRTVSMTFV